MRKTWAATGRAVYRLLRPVIGIVLPRTRRTRVLLVSDRQVLVVRAWLGDGRWQLPGGGLHRGERPAAGARRELREETSVTVSLEQLSEPYERRWQGDDKHSYYLYVIQVTEQYTVRPRWPELTDCQWLPASSLDAGNASTDVIDALTVMSRQHGWKS